MAYPAPNGRELAIEALLDREPHGDAYRVSRVLEEVVPMALQNRPNRMTTAALVEEAFGLQRQPRRPAPLSTRRLATMDSQQKERRAAVLDFHERITTNITTTTTEQEEKEEQESSAVVAERWLEWLQNVWSSADDKKSSSAAPSLKVLQERLYREKDTTASSEGEEGGRKEETTTPFSDRSVELSMEQIMSRLLPLKSGDVEGETKTAEHVAAVWLVITLLLANEMSEPLQCGHLLSLLQYENDTNSAPEPFQLDPTVLSYFGEAAAVCQERWMAQKPAAIPNTSDAAAAASPAAVASMEEADGPSSPVVVTQNLTTAAEEVPAAPTEEEEDQDIDMEDNEGGAEPHEPSDANVIRPDCSDSSSDSDSSDSDSSSSESSSDEEAARAELFVESERSVGDETEDETGNPSLLNNRVNNNVDEEEGEEGDDYDTLRQALALAVNEDTTSMAAVRVIVNQTNDETEEEPLTETPVSDGPTDGTEDFPEDEEEEEEEEEETIEEPEVALPAFPVPPTQPPFSSPVAVAWGESDGEAAKDNDEMDWQAIFDPTNSKQFAALPRSHVLVHLMRYAEALASSISSANATEESEDISLPTVPGGMGAFLYNVSSVWDGEAVGRTTSSLSTDRASAKLIFQLMTTTFVALCKRRTESIQQLQQVIDKEQRAIQGEVVTVDDGHPTGGDNEEDDPATAFAMSHVEDDDVPLSIEVLQNKGMRRKAAAAAHDTAALLRTVRKEKEDIKGLLIIDSTSILTVLVMVRQFLATILEDRISSRDGTVADLRDFVTSTVRNQVLDSLEKLTNPRLAALSESSKDTELWNETFLEVSLYKEAVLAWGEMSPFLYDVHELSNVFVSTLEDKSVHTVDIQGKGTFESVDSITVLPSHSSHCRAHRLQVLARRYQYDDVLNQMIGVPVPWLVGTDADSDEPATTIDVLESPRFPRNVLSSLRNALDDIEFGKLDLEEFYAAVCHKINTKLLLFDGLHAISKPETNGITPIASSKKGLDSSAIHVHATPVSRLMFDSTKCADSIAIVSGADLAASSGNGPSVNQRASKVWGAVLSTQYFSPKSGIHRWAVKLDKCERGHVFIGVSTSQASVRTYVGGDKHGWGMIGTQALWHDRRKVRGDYGGTFRTGSTIIVTLDTDAGTLSFGSWKNSQSSSTSPSLDPLVHNLLSPRRQTAEGGDYDDWGVAFEGLPLDARLFPAVGLYQRDDKVTLLPVDSGNAGSGSIAWLGGICFYPDIDDITDEKRKEECRKVRKHNNSLLSDATSYASETLDYEFGRISRNPGSATASLIVRSLLASLSLLPTSVPLLSTRTALAILPKLFTCLETTRSSKEIEASVSGDATLELMPGDWVIRASSGSGDLEEYKVRFDSVFDKSENLVGFRGRGVGTTGKSKNGHVMIWGSLKGTSITFVEDWTDEKLKGSGPAQSGDISACVVTARITLDGTKFEGSYKNVDFASGGQIVGFCLKAENENSLHTQRNWPTKKSILLSSAFNRLVSAISNDIPGDCERIDVGITQNDVIDRIQKKNSLRATLSRRFVSSASLVGASDPMGKCVRALDAFFSFEHRSGGGSHPIASLFEGELPDSREETPSSAQIMEKVLLVDNKMTSLTGGLGSLRLLCPNDYDSARRLIVGAMVYHTSCVTGSLDDEEWNASDNAKIIWQKSLQIMEDGLRHGLTGEATRKTEASKAVCARFKRLSDFLFQLCPTKAFDSLDDVVDEISALYKSIEELDDIDLIEAWLMQRTVRSTLSLAGILCVKKVICSGKKLSLEGLETVIAGIPQVFGSLRSRDMFSEEGQSTVLSLGHETLSLPLGFSGQVRSCLNESLRVTLNILVSELNNRGSSSGSRSTRGSLHLSILATFASIFVEEDPHVCVDLLKQISNILSDYRAAALDDKPDDFGTSVVASVGLTVDRDMSRAILRSATAVAHAVIYSVGAGKNTSQTHGAIKAVTSWLLAELEVVVPFLEASFASDISAINQECSINEWSCWTEISSTVPKANDTENEIQANAGLQFFWEHGTLTSTPARTSSKDTARDRSSQKESKIDIRSKLESGFRNRHFAHWLHILCAVLRTKKLLNFLCSDSAWLKLLLGAIGLDCSFANVSMSTVSLRTRDKGLLPARHRARTISLMYHFLSATKPSKAVVGGLFGLAGASCVFAGTEGEERVSRETVSVLRKLHNPVNAEWRQTINELLPIMVDSNSFARKAGLRAMLGGSLVNIEPLCRVLLKPAAASAIAKEGHSSSQMKSQSSISAAQVPAGADHVVAGLMRYSAEGGIVSSVDTKTGICEVILIQRKNSVDDILNRNERSGGIRKHLTVRALRTQSTDLVAAEEEALVIDDSVPVLALLQSMFEKSVDSLLLATASTTDSASIDTKPSAEVESDEKKRDDFERNDILGLTLNLMSLKSSILLLSNATNLEEFFASEGSTSTMTNLLDLAWPERTDELPLSKLMKTAKGSSIASLSWHEAKYCHLISAAGEIRRRSHSMKFCQPDIWTERAKFLTGVIEASSKKGKPATSPIEPETTARSQTTSTANSTRASQPLRNSGQSSVGSDSDDEGAGDGVDAQHLREAAIVQMAELGIPRPYAELALRRVGGTNIEAAVHFCLEHEAEIERLLAEEMSRQAARRDGGGRDVPDNSHLLNQLLEMGFKRRWCVEALANTGNNVDEALTWILTNTEMLENMYNSDEDGDEENAEEDEESEEEEEEEDTDEGENPPTGIQAEDDTKVDVSVVSKDWALSVVPLRLISGKATIDPKTLEVTGRPNGGFASVGMKGVLLQTGKYYYEVVLGTAGCIQVGFADSSFAGHCNAERGDGCGDSSSSFSFDGWRRLRWHSTATEWGCRWQEGDVIGCLLDIDNRRISFTINGQGEEVGMGVAFSNFDYCGGLYPVVSFNRKESVRLILGGSGEAFKYPPPPEFQGVGDALPSRIQERTSLLKKENCSRESNLEDEPKGFICDYSDEDHGHELFSWSHRYYGSDASVHLGSIRSNKHGGNARSNGTPDIAPSSMIDQRLRQVWSESWALVVEKEAVPDEDGLEKLIENGYEAVQKELVSEVFSQSIFLGLTLSRKLLLHTLVSCKYFNPDQYFNKGETKKSDMIRLVKILEVCVGAQNWTGEASAMAMAAESLGLGVQVQSRRLGRNDVNEMIFFRTGFTQVLSSIMYFKDDKGIRDTSALLAAAAEGSFASDTTAALTFLLRTLQQAAISSEAFREALLATVRRGVRLLALVDDSEAKQQALDEDDGVVEGENQEEEDRESSELSPDAKLVSFFSGLLLSEPVSRSVKDDKLFQDLFGAWSVGLLSASLPWRMICAQTCAVMLNERPWVFCPVLRESHSLASYYGRLPSAVVRRVWAERAATPVCSRYVQSMIELLAAVRRSEAVSKELPEEFTRFWNKIDVEASCPRPLVPSLSTSEQAHPLDTNGLMVDNDEIWTGYLEHDEVEWKKPARTTVRTLMDGGEGPPMLRVGCLVMRGPDWEKTEDNTKVDGYQQYESEKAARAKVIKSTSQTSEEESKEGDSETKCDPTEPPDSGHKKKRKKPPHPKLPIGTVVAIEPWNGIPALGRRVKWALTGEEGVYRFGGDGGRFDIMHVETNQKRTRVVKKYPFPETAEQSASRRGFGTAKSFAVILRLPRKRYEQSSVRGILEIPDFGAGLDVSCAFNEDKTVTIVERGVLYGQKDAGWEARFGEPSYVPGTKYCLALQTGDEKETLRSDPFFEELAGATNFNVKNLKNPANGSPICAKSTLRLVRGKTTENIAGQMESASPPPLAFDRHFHATNLSVSKDQRTILCSASDGRGSAFVSTGFSKGVHYWEVTLGQVSESGSVFIGCAEKPAETPARLNRWLGWGFVNFRATYSGGSERVYGVHAHTGDVIGVLLDCDAGRISFFYDGLKYGEHIISDLGCAYENLAPFGFSAEGCGTGGHGQAAPNGLLRSSAQGFVKPKTLFPVIGLKHQGDRVTLSPIWSSTYGVDGTSTLRNVLAVEDLLHKYGSEQTPEWFIREAFAEHEKWVQSFCTQIVSRGSRPYRIELDTSPFGCAKACAAIGLDYALLPGDRIRMKRSFGRVLELAEDAVILGQNQLRLYYRIVAQKNEGQSLSEGGYLPHYIHEFDVVDGVDFLSPPKGKNVPLPRLDRYRCASPEGLKVVYSGGAIIRSDLEISDQSQNLGSITSGTVIPQESVLDRRVNSCGVLRYKIRYEEVEGYISAHIQGGSEEAIVMQVQSPTDLEYPDPASCAKDWYKEWAETAGNSDPKEDPVGIQSFEEFRKEYDAASSSGISPTILDSLMSETLCLISNFSESGDALGCSYTDALECLAYARRMDGQEEEFSSDSVPLATKHAVASLFAKTDLGAPLPSLAVLVSRASSVRALNRRARYALPWLTTRPSQEGSSVLGGSVGLGCSVDKAGRSWRPDNEDSVAWIYPDSVGRRIRDLRNLIFSNIKREFLSDVTVATTTPTPLSHDEYELPREIRTVRINRMRAARALQAAEKSVKRKYSVFAQLQSETRNLGGAALRRGYVAKGHGGQKRAFRVKLVGEGVNDYSGPYREVFTDAFSEILKTDNHGLGVLGVLDSTPNRSAEIGENRDLYMFSLNGQLLSSVRKDLDFLETTKEEIAIREHFASLIAPRNEASREVENALVFLGRITGTAYRHGIPVELPLPMKSIWQAIVEGEPERTSERLKELDILAAKATQTGALLWWQRRMLNAFVDGLGNVIPVELLPLLSAEELRDTICGSPDIDVDLLKSVVEYEGYSENDAVIGYFWEALREATNMDRRNFLQYVWARSRLPLRAADFESPFKIMRDSSNTNERADQALPSASTCFFSLTLPEYSSAEVLKDKLMYAINNVTTMETDFQTNSSEIAEGYRAL